MTYIERTIEVDSLRVEIVADEYCDNHPGEGGYRGSLMFCWLRDHNIGDNLREHGMPTDSSDLHYQFEGWSDVEKTLVRKYRPLCIMPVYASIHSNIHLSIGNTVSDDFDSRQVGFIFDHGDDLTGFELRNALNARLQAYADTMRCALKDLEILGDDPDELEQNLEQSIEDYAEKIRAEEPGFREAYDKMSSYLAAQVEEYDDYLNGNVWGWRVVDEHGDTLESCWGYIGSPRKTGVIEDGVSTAKWIIENEAKQERLCAQAMHL